MLFVPLFLPLVYWMIEVDDEERVFFVSAKPICLNGACSASSNETQVAGSVAEAGFPVRGFIGILSAFAQTHCLNCLSSAGIFSRIFLWLFEFKLQRDLKLMIGFLWVVH